MGTGADLAWLRREAHLPLADAAKALGVSSIELWAFEGRARNVSDKLFEKARKVYCENQRPAPTEPVEEYVAGLPEQEMCCHHWRLEAPAGPTSEGVCQDCGAVRAFQNGSPDIRIRGPYD